MSPVAVTTVRRMRNDGDDPALLRRALDRLRAGVCLRGAAFSTPAPIPAIQATDRAQPAHLLKEGTMYAYRPDSRDAAGARTRAADLPRPHDRLDAAPAGRGPDGRAAPLGRPLPSPPVSGTRPVRRSVLWWLWCSGVADRNRPLRGRHHRHRSPARPLLRVGVGLLTGWLGLHGPALADQYSPAPRIIQQIPFPGGTWTFIDLEQTALRTAMYWRTYLTLVYEPQAWAPGCLDGHWYPNLYFGTLTDRTWPPFRFGKFRSSAPGDGSLWSMWRMHVLPSTLKVDPLPDAPPPSAAMEVTGGAVNDTSILNLTCVYAQISAQQTFPNGIRPQR